MSSITASTDFTGMLRRVLQPTVLLTVVAPYAAYQVLTAHGASEVAALSAASVFPLAAVISTAVRSRRLEFIGLLSAASIALGLLTGLVLHDPHVLLVKDSLVSGALGLVFLGSLAARRPLTFHFARQLNGGRAAPELEQRWVDSTSFRDRMRQVTTVWGVALLGEATLRIVLAFLIPPSVLLAISPLLAAAVIAPVAAWTFYRRRHANS